ncbi:putative transmembrane protein [Kordia algicida OT-1]|uniref:Putative transmembrane protein n=1 Tax=Kordia algicida OT-1 TaxID=391587 RepID=A9E687_9FLAO|nr:putative transmembrane protein [Kordia algicida OT-1]
MAIIVCFIVSFIFPRFFYVSKLLLLIFLTFTFLDIIILYLTRTGIVAKRQAPEKFSNGDENEVFLRLENYYTFAIYTKIIDEIPEQFQVRDFSIEKKIKASSVSELKYMLRPTERGEYKFGKLNVYVMSILGLVSRRFFFDNEVMVPTYPAFLQLKKYELLAISNNLTMYGIKKIRRIGHTMEFEQIKEYVTGDDLRTINWKATAKRNQLMVNQYQDEKSQPVYSVIDKGRVMKMPFNELSLLDYAINATLVMSNVILKKQDKAGMFTFSKKVENMVVAEKRSAQMSMILESLYNVDTDFFESDFGRLYADIKRNIKHRSLILLYTNFETMDALNRQLPYLKGIAKSHLLVVIFFKNTELDELINEEATTIQEAYDKVIAEKFSFEKRLIVNELKKYGIYSILTTPENLTIDTINKYLEMKARGMV